MKLGGDILEVFEMFRGIEGLKYEDFLWCQIMTIWSKFTYNNNIVKFSYYYYYCILIELIPQNQIFVQLERERDCYI